MQDSTGLSSTPIYNFGLCESPQKNILSTDGFEMLGGEGSAANAAQPPRPPCAVDGLNGTVLVLTPMHNRAHVSKGELAIDRYFRWNLRCPLRCPSCSSAGFDPCLRAQPRW